MIKRSVGAIILAILPLVLFTSPVLAILPANTVTINNIDVYRDCVETDDQLYVIDYTVYYAAPPTEDITEAYIFRLMNGATELKSSTAYAYDSDGYGRGIVSIYFSATEVTDKGMGWIGAYTVAISGNPTLTWGGTGCPYVNSTSYRSWNDPMGVVLGERVMVMAETLNIAWGLTTTALTVTIGGSVSLSSYGADYFATSIPNLLTMQPDIFLSDTVAAGFHERDNPLTYSTSIGIAAWAGTWVDDAIQPTATAFNVSATFVYGFIWVVVILVLLGYIALKFRAKFEILLLVGGVLTIFGSILHFLPMLIPVLVGASLVILATWLMFWGHSSA